MLYGNSYDGCACLQKRSYNANVYPPSYAYNIRNRLTASCGEGSSLSANVNRFTEQITGYDKNGNILGLKRYGQTGTSTYGLFDNLTMTLSGNQLKSVGDVATFSAYNNGFEFRNGITSSQEYDYDKNGNLTQDLNKDISKIEYNLLNLPLKVTFKDGSTFNYIYGGNGVKLKTIHKIGGTTTTTEYCSNVIYENGIAKRLLTEVGYITLSDKKSHYYLQDHQGNNRVVINESGSVEEVNHYYPFGGLYTNSTNVQPYKYNGKELDTKKGLNWYDYGARMYDAAVGRWHAVDPLAEKYYEVSPYIYCANDPVKNVDSDGRWFWAAAGAVIDYGFQVYDNYRSGKSGYDAWVGNVNFVSVGLSAINPTGKLKIAKTFIVEAAKETISYTANEGLGIKDDLKTIATNALISTTVGVGAGKLTESSSNKALENANKEMRTANQNVRTARSRVDRRPNSESKRIQLETAKFDAQKTRIKQVGTQMLNSTIGQMNSNAVEEIITRGVDRFNLKMDWNDEEYKKP